MSVLEVALDPATVIVAVDPGKAFNRVWISNGSGMLVDPMSLSVSREGIAQPFRRDIHTDSFVFANAPTIRMPVHW